MQRSAFSQVTSTADGGKDIVFSTAKTSDRKNSAA